MCQRKIISKHVLVFHKKEKENSKKKSFFNGRDGEER